MNERALTVFEQYELDITETFKIRMEIMDVTHMTENTFCRNMITATIKWYQ